MRDFKVRVSACLDIIESDFGSFMHIPKSNDILLNMEFMNPITLAHATYDHRTTNIPNIISFNVKYANDYKGVFTDEIIPHELAHIICFNNDVMGDNHGDAWKQICTAMGGSGNEFIGID